MNKASRASTTMIMSTLLAAVLMVSALPVLAQPAATRIGYVDMKRLLDNAPQVVAGRQKLEREFAPRDSELIVEETRLATMRSRQERESAGVTNETSRREIDALDRSIKRKREALRGELKSRSDQELDRSWREINNAVIEFAREQNIDLIVPSPVVYASQRIDVTDQVLERLKLDFKKQAPAQ
ncbi:MAG: OmpH family outer membrane protein [Dokdonella sp.]